MSLFANSRKRINSAPYFMVFAWFGGIILAGSLLLWLPWAHATPGVRLDYISALFTAVSSACVTGLTVVNVGETFSPFGQAVMFLLIELGGMGVITFASLGFRLFRRRLSLGQQAVTADAIYQNDAATEFRHTFMQILRVTLAIQAIGAVCSAVALAPRHLPKGEHLELAWSAVFHSVSAFCNAGFTIYPDGLGATGVPFLAIVAVLIVLGGLGHQALNELYHLPKYIRRREKGPYWLSLNTRVVLWVTGILLVAGALGIWILGTARDHTSLGEAVFSSVTARTAGFDIFPQGRLPLPSCLIMILLMFIGGSPGSCAGGIKTTSIAIWMARIRANLRNDSSVNLLGFTIAPELVSRARIIMALTVFWIATGVFVLSILHPDEALTTLLFEEVSAIGTVGLSMEFTPKLTDLSRLWICLTMFVGRLGPLSLALWVWPVSKAKIGRPIGRIMVG